MLTPPLPPNESARLQSLRELMLLDTPREAAFDRITETAQKIFKVGSVLISLVDANRQWFKSCVGVDATETGRDISFCGHAILQSQLFVVPNALDDTRFADNPLVTGDLHLRFYAGRPLRSPQGLNIGTLCLLDWEPRAWSDEDAFILERLGCWAESEIRLRELSQLEQNLLREIEDIQRGNLLDRTTQTWNSSTTEELLSSQWLQTQKTQRAFACTVWEVASEQVETDIKHLSDILRQMISPQRDTLGRLSARRMLVIHLDHPEQARRDMESLWLQLQAEPCSAKLGMGFLHTSADEQTLEVADILTMLDNLGYQSQQSLRPAILDLQTAAR